MLPSGPRWWRGEFGTWVLTCAVVAGTPRLLLPIVMGLFVWGAAAAYLVWFGLRLIGFGVRLAVTR